MQLILKQNRKKELISFLNSVNLEINNLELLNLALTHSSYSKEKASYSLVNNERLEFFGDAVLKLYVSEYLVSKYANYTEGQLTKLRAFVISDKVLANIASKLDFKKYILAGKVEKKNMPDSILAGSLEALLAVIYYECGGAKVRKFILNNWIYHINLADLNEEKDNYKAALQEYTQGHGLGLPVYTTLCESGPDHKKEFEVAVFVNENKLAVGKGKTKKEASQRAAKIAINLLKK